MNSSTHTKEHEERDEFFFKKGFSTRAVHYGQHPDPVHGGLVTSISLSTTFAQRSPAEPYGAYDYSRCGNPTREAFEKCMASLEKAKYGLAFSSGCGTTITVTHLLKSGEHMIVSDDVYGGTQRYFRHIAGPNQGLEFTFLDMRVADDLKAAIKENTRMVFIETPTNPLLKIYDIKALAEICKARGVLLVVDNTFMTPYFQNPLELGADIVVHSLTKYIGGHSDVVMGAICLNDKELRDKLFFIQKSMGAIPSPFDCYLALRGAKTLGIRMDRIQQNALKVAEFLERSEKVERVIYPGLKSFPQYELHLRQTRGSSGMISFYIKGGLDEAKSFLQKIKVFALAESLGAVESLAEHPALMTHASVAPEHRKHLGITDNLIRLSVGIEEVEDLLEDIEQALGQ
jgi:cystathionine gamma-lyase